MWFLGAKNFMLSDVFRIHFHMRSNAGIMADNRGPVNQWESYNCIIRGWEFNKWVYSYLLQSVRWCLHDTGAIFVTARVHPSFLWWLCVSLRDITRKCYACASSPWFLHRPENFIPVGNPATASWNLTSRAGLKRVPNALISSILSYMYLINVKCVFMHTRCEITLASCKHDMKASSHPGLLLSPGHLLTHVNT